MVILTEFYKMLTEHNIIPGVRSHKTLPNRGLAGPPVRTSWDLTTSGVRKCTGGVLSSQVKIPGVHQSIEGCCMSSLCRVKRVCEMNFIARDVT
jgi:hypothetical protein